MRSLVRLSMVVVIASALGADWKQFRGPGGQGVSGETNLPATWSDNENLAWKVPLPGYGASSPITLGGRVYVTCYSGYAVEGAESADLDDLQRHVVCLDQATGRIHWNKTVEVKPGESKRVRDHGYAGGTPVTDGEKLYVFFGRGGVFAFDLDGNQLWDTEVGTGVHGWGSATSPVLYKDFVIVNASIESNSLVALDKRTGKEVWRVAGMRRSWSTPLLVDTPGGKQELVVSVHSRILGFDPANGEELWSCAGIQDYVCPSVVSKNGVVFAIGGRRATAIAVRAGGRGDVTESHKLWEKAVGSNVTSPVIQGDHLYWVSHRGIAYCLKLADGEEVYRERINIGRVYASATAADGKLYVVSRQRGAVVLAAKPEFEQLAHNKLDDDSIFNASPAISGGKLFVRSDKHLYCIVNK